ncbi:hypothetical protein Tco_0900370 [Tanacetum coccineum]
MITYLKNQGGYKESYFKRMSYNDIRPIFERVWDHINTFIPIGSEDEKDSSKPSERETSKTVEKEKVEEEDVNLELVLIEKKAVGIRRKTLVRRRASDKQGQDNSKRQKKEKETADYEEEKDELRMWLTVVPNEEEFNYLKEQTFYKLKVKIYSVNDPTSGQHGQILNETSNKAKIKKEIDVLETMNIELEHSVAKLRKENETLKKHYKDLYDSIKITRSKTIEQTTSLLANNTDLKAQIQENVFAIAALKNDLRKLKGNSVDTKFAKTSVLGKPIYLDEARKKIQERDRN